MTHHEAAQIDATILKKFDELVGLRRHLHAFPELSMHEFKTTALLAERLRALGYEVRVRPQGNGLLADLTPAGFDPTRDPTLAIRADLDALPITEANEVAYASAHTGVMHACGHDVHMTCAMGASIALGAIKDDLPGRVRIVYQHAEEVAPSGGPEMVEFGAIDGVNAIVALHCDPQSAAGTISIRDGALTAAFDRFELVIKGTGGHGARPHHCVDPIFLGTQVAQGLYTAISRQYDAREPMVLSIGEFQAGHAPNVIPETARLTGTVRTLSYARREEVEPLLRQIVGGLCQMHGASYALDLYRGTPPILNNPTVNAAFARAAEQVFGHPESVLTLEHPSMGSEDFAHYLKHIPGAMFRLGTAKADRPVHLLHTPRFDIDERAIGWGARILARSVQDLLGQLRQDPDLFAH